MSLPTDSMARKGTPVFYGFLNYFPDAVAEVARLSLAANDKHNPGEPLHWSKEKSNDHADCLVRHLLEHGEIDPDDGFSHTVKVAWRAMALLQMELEAKAAVAELAKIDVVEVFAEEYDRRREHELRQAAAEERSVLIRINDARLMGLGQDLQGRLLSATYDPSANNYRVVTDKYNFKVTPKDVAQEYVEVYDAVMKS